MCPTSDLLVPFGEDSRDFAREEDDEAEEIVSIVFESKDLLAPSVSPLLRGESERKGELAPEDVADDLVDGASFLCWSGAATAEGVDELELKLAAFAFVATAAHEGARDGLGS